MNPRHRDGLLALVVTAGLLAVASTSGLRATDLLRPAPLALGGAGALGLELLMARFPERSVALWERRSVRLGGSALVVVAGGFLTVTAGSWVLAALLGGVATYFVLLVLVLSAVVPAPETWFERE